MWKGCRGKLFVFHCHFIEIPKCSHLIEKSRVSPEHSFSTLHWMLCLLQEEKQRKQEVYISGWRNRAFFLFQMKSEGS
jgi:hypothetical protein